MAMPNMIYFVLALLLGAIILFMAFSVAIGDVERNLISLRLLACPRANIEIRAVVVKTLLVVIATTLEAYGKVQAVLLAAAAIYLVWIYLREVGHLSGSSYACCFLFVILLCSLLLISDQA